MEQIRQKHLILFLHPIDRGIKQHLDQTQMGPKRPWAWLNGDWESFFKSLWKLMSLFWYCRECKHLVIISTISLHSDDSYTRTEWERAHPPFLTVHSFPVFLFFYINLFCFCRYRASNWHKWTLLKCTKGRTRQMKSFKGHSVMKWVCKLNPSTAEMVGSAGQGWGAFTPAPSVAFSLQPGLSSELPPTLVLK